MRKVADMTQNASFGHKIKIARGSHGTALLSTKIYLKREKETAHPTN